MEHATEVSQSGEVKITGFGLIPIDRSTETMLSHLPSQGENCVAAV